MSKYLRKKQKGSRGYKNPLFYFGLAALFLWGMPFFSFGSLAQIDNLKNNGASLYSPFFKNIDNLESNNSFFNQNSHVALESPDLKIIQDGFVYGISTPRILTPQTLGDIFGESSQAKRDVQDYTVESGDTIASVAQKFSITQTTLMLANDLSKNSSLKAGQILTILPVDGLLHVVKSGDTVGEISKKYRAKVDNIIAFNNLSNEGDIFIGDVLMIAGGIMPPKPVRSFQAALPDSFFIYPAEGKITQGLHYYNAVDLANNCGTSIYAAASGVVQRARYDYRYGNYITVLHSNGVVTYYGHVQTMFVKSGDSVTVGDRIASMGSTGNRSTGCHLHFGVSGAQNPLAKYYLGAMVKFK